MLATLMFSNLEVCSVGTAIRTTSVPGQKAVKAAPYAAPAALPAAKEAASPKVPPFFATSAAAAAPPTAAGVARPNVVVASPELVV